MRCWQYCVDWPLSNDRNFEVVVADDGSRDEHQQSVLQAAVSKTCD